MAAAGTAGAMFVGALASPGALARPESSLMREFEEAAEEFGVPVGLLIAMGYVNTRWEMPPPAASEYEEGSLHGWGGYGIMALVKNPSSDTLGEASRLTGIPEQKLKTDRRSNIRGGAALLAEAREKQGRPMAKNAARQDTLSREAAGSWVETVSGRGVFTALGVRQQAPAAAGVGGGAVYAEQVAQALSRGASGKNKAGEQVTLKARTMAAEVLERLGVG